MFVALLVAVLYFNVVLYLKASLVVFFLTLLLACIVARASFRLHIVMTLLTVACLLLLQGLLGCYRSSFSEVSNSRVPVVSKWVSLQGDHVAADNDRASALVLAAESQPARPEGLERVVDAAIIFVRSAVFRMAASLPYYVQVFSNPAERCGIESNSIPFLPRETCYPATKVGTHVNPGIMQAYQAAPAHINAYAELGLGYAFVVLILGGLILGFAWGVTLKAQSPLFWSAGAAVCVFGYYLTQAGLVGALTHSYGLVWYLFPIITAAIIHSLARTVMSRLSPRSTRRHL
jgi:hypothetical protein